MPGWWAGFWKFCGQITPITWLSGLIQIIAQAFHRCNANFSAEKCALHLQSSFPEIPIACFLESLRKRVAFRVKRARRHLRCGSSSKLALTLISEERHEASHYHNSTEADIRWGTLLVFVRLVIAGRFRLHESAGVSCIGRRYEVPTRTRQGVHPRS